LLGELDKEGKEIRILPALRITTDKGVIEIPVNEIVEFKGKTEKTN
jgi:hypothetical protein